jgi:thiosulfate/3-mercaptopyruvate sulfurtransferase
MDALVTTEWLAGELGAADLHVVDATYFGSVPGGPGRDARAEYEAEHIPGAVFLDLDTLADTISGLPSMLPSPEQFAARLGSLGIGDGDRIVLYDVSHYHTATRAWWMLRTMGARHIAILDGGLAKWRVEDRPIANGVEQPAPRHFTARLDPAGVRTLAQMKINVASGIEQVLDARSAARFSGVEPDPRPGTAAGHIPGSRNLPYGRLLNADGTWKRGDALRAEFDAAGIDLARPLVTTCGSGITAAVLAFGAYLLGNDSALYDGSWSEWGGDPSTPKATGTA